MRRPADGDPSARHEGRRLRTIVLLLCGCAVSASSGPVRRLQQTQAQESHFHSVGDPFSDSCLDHLNADTQGRLLPAVCPKYTLVPRHASPGQHGCVAQSVAEAVVDDQGKQVVVVIEENGWRSQSLVNALATVLLQEALGYQVVLLHDTRTQSVAQRVSQSVSHATLEYWAFGKEAAHSSEVASKRVTLGAVGYLGEVGLYAMDTCRAANSSIWWEWHMTYVNDAAATRAYLSHNDAPNSVPGRTYRLNSTGEMAWVSSTRTVTAMECTSPICTYGQFYPRACEPDHETRISSCPEVFLEQPNYNEGYFEGLLAGHGAQLTGVYLGAAMRDVLADFQANHKPAVFYAFHPSDVYSQFPASRIVFPQRAAGVGEREEATAGGSGLRYYDYPTQPLQKVLNAQAFNDSYLQPAMRLLQALTVSERHVLALMKMASSTSPHDAVCALVAQDATLLDLLRALMPTLVEPVSKPSVSAWQLARLLLLLLMPFLFMAFSFLIRIGKEEEASTSIAQAINWSTQLLKAVLSGPAIGVGMLTCFILALRTLSVAVLNESFHNTLYAVLYTLSILVSGYLLWCVFQVALSLVQSRMDALAAKGTTEAGQGEHLYVSKALVPFARSVCTALIVMTAIILLMRRFGDNTTSVLITSAFGFTIALTMSEVLKDWFAGAMVLSDNQYIVGDWVVIHGGKKVEGCVEEVSLRYTKVRGLDEHLYYVKNREISTAVVENITARPASRIDVNFYISATADPGKVQLFLSVLRKQTSSLSGFASFYHCHLAGITQQGFFVKMAITSYHAPSNERYQKLKNWGYQWVWMDPYFNLITELHILVPHLLKTFGLHLGGELRVNPSRPLHIHTSQVGVESVKAAEEAEVSTLCLDTLVDSSLETPMELNSAGIDELSDSTVTTNEFSMFCTTFNMSKNPLVAGQLHHWLPMPGAVDMLVVGVQNCDYKVPPRSVEWMATARRVLVSRLGGGRVHFDFLATLVHYLGSNYKLIGDVSRDKTRLAVFMLKAKAGNVSAVRVDTSVYQSQSAHNSANAAALSLLYYSTPLLFVNVSMPRFDALFKGGTVPGREAMAMRNRILTNLLQQLPAVRQVANADLLVQFRGVVVLGAMNYGSRGNHEQVSAQVTRVFRDRIREQRRKRRLKEMEKRYHLIESANARGGKGHTGKGLARVESWATIDENSENLPETVVPDFEWHEHAKGVGLAALDLAAAAVTFDLEYDSSPIHSDSPSRTHSAPLDNLARSARTLALSVSEVHNMNLCNGSHPEPSPPYLMQGVGVGHVARAPQLREDGTPVARSYSDSTDSTSDKFGVPHLNPEALRLDTEEISMFHTVYHEVDALRRELKNGQVLSGFEDTEPMYLPNFGYEELLPLLWERTGADAAKGSPQGLQTPKRDKRSSLVRSGSFSTAPSGVEEYCQKPMWADRVLWRGTETDTLECVHADAHMRIKSSAHKPVSTSFVVRACKLPSLFQLNDVGLSSVNTLSSSMEVCSLVVTGLTVKGLASKRFAASSSTFYMLFQGEALLSEETMTGGPTLQTPGAGAASTRTSKAKVHGGTVSFPDDLMPVLHSQCRHRYQLQHLVLVFSLVDCTPWHTSEIVTGSASLHLKHVATQGVGQEAVSFRAELTSGGRIVGEVSGDIAVDEGDAGVHHDEDDIVLQTLDPGQAGDAFGGV